VDLIRVNDLAADLLYRGTNAINAGAV